MMIAVPEATGDPYRDVTPAALATELTRLAAHVSISRSPQAPTVARRRGAGPAPLPRQDTRLNQPPPGRSAPREEGTFKWLPARRWWSGLDPDATVPIVVVHWPATRLKTEWGRISDDRCFVPRGESHGQGSGLRKADRARRVPSWGASRAAALGHVPLLQEGGGAARCGPGRCDGGAGACRGGGRDVGPGTGGRAGSAVGRCRPGRGADLALCGRGRGIDRRDAGRLAESRVLDPPRSPRRLLGPPTGRLDQRGRTAQREPGAGRPPTGRPRRGDGGRCRRRRRLQHRARFHRARLLLGRLSGARGGFRTDRPRASRAPARDD